ncbi:sigma-70 family RNA polymerase sigma factor, partial [Conexibacter stalactiti]
MRPALTDALLSTQTDERLVALTRAGHERAFAAIVERYRRPLIGFARRIAPDSRAEDVVQQALTSAWAALAAGAEVAHLRGWLHQIVRHEAIRIAKQEGQAIADPLASGVAGSTRDAADTAAERERVRDALAGIAELPPRQREALVQTTLAGRSRTEVAAALGLSEGAVRQLLHRARTALRTAATALTPLPVASWAASLGGPGSAGVAEVGAGGGSATLAGV